jgi:4-amino-4-deoxy-L-arabinose transferase-like glycosyltransferase
LKRHIVARNTPWKMNFNILLASVIALSLFTHLYNLIGSPSVPSNDEAIYLRRAVHVLEGQGPQEGTLYDHPYFGQLFLAAALGIIGYPYSLNALALNVHSVEMLYLIPKMLMGTLAMLDTFLIYKISEHRYNRNVAIIASILFAVMPLTLILRRMWLEPIQLPFLLLSMYFAIILYSKNSKDRIDANENKDIKRILPVLFSGIFLGLSIFTKIPVFTMIPLIGFLVYASKESGRSLKTIGLWFIPVILIPLAWPAYAIYHGQFNLWLDGLLWQTHRGVNTFFASLAYDFNIDPVLMVLGLSGLVFAAFKRDLYILLWSIPFLIFLYIVGFVSYWHFVPLFPAFCIAAARLIEYLSNFVNLKTIHKYLSILFIVVCAIVIFGLVNTTVLITTNYNPNYYRATLFVIQYLLQDKQNNQDYVNSHDKITVIANPSYTWLPQYIFHLNTNYYTDYLNNPVTVKTNRVLFVIDSSFAYELKHRQLAEQIQRIYSLNNNNNKNIIATFDDKNTNSNRVSILMVHLK